MNDFTFTAKAFQDYLYWQTEDKKVSSTHQLPCPSFMRGLGFSFS